MKTVQTRTLLFLVVLLLSACAKDKVSPTVNEEFLLSEIRLDDKLHTRYTHDEKRRVATVSMFEKGQQILTSTCTYNDDGLLAVMKITVPGGTQVEELRYSADKKIKERRTSYDGVLHMVYDYTWNGNVLTTTGREVTTGATIVQRFTYDDRNNISEIFTQNGPVWNKVELLDYDDKKTFRELPLFFPPSANYPRRRIVTTQNSVREYTHSYTHNAAGYTLTEQVKNDKTGATDNFQYKLIKK